MNRQKWIIAIIVTIGGVIIFCCVCFWLTGLSASTPQAKATSTARKSTREAEEAAAAAIAQATEAARPTDTPGPTDTPPPTPIPTATPSDLTMADIERQYEDLTDLQWEDYILTLPGVRIHWIGTVNEVTDDGTIILDIGQGFFRSVYLDGLDIEIGKTLNKGMLIEFDATIRKATTFLGLSIWLENPTLISP